MSGEGGGQGAGAVFGVMGSLMEASDKEHAYNDQADELERNARINRQVGKFNVMRQQIIANKKFGAIAADYAASGLSQDSGSVLDVLAASHANSELDRLSILHGAEVKSTAMEDRAREDRSSADRAVQMGYFNAFASVFGGATSYGNSSDTADNKARADAIDTGRSSRGYGSAGGGRSAIDEDFYA